MRRFIVALLLLSAGGCVTAESYTTGDGRQAYFVDCSGDFNSWPQCYAKAREVCGGNFEELSRRESPVVSGTGTTVSTTFSRALEVACTS